MTTRQRVDGPPLHRAASVDSFDDEARTVRLSFSSEEPCLRASFWDEPWVEVLGHNDDEVDMSRLASGTAPVLFGHNAFDREAHVGVVDKAWLKDGRGYADIRISKRAGADGVWQDIKDGILKSVSVGYKINERTLTKANEGSANEYRVTRWLPMEVSLVPVPADATVGVGRSSDPLPRFTVTAAPEGPHSAGLLHSRTNEMTDQTAPAAPAVTEPAASAPVDNTRAVADATIAASQRAVEILGIATKAGLDQAFASEHIAANSPIDKVRAAALDAMAERASKVQHNPSIQTGADQIDKTRAAAESWLLHRSGEKVESAALNGNEFRGMSLVELARKCVALDGGSTRGMTNSEAAAYAMRAGGHLSTSTFPILLQNTMHKALEAAYTNVPDVWREFCAVGNLSDFRPHYRYRAGSFGNLSTVTENNEFTHGTLVDGERESITAGTKGKLLTITRQMIVNDDLGVFMNLVRAMGRGAARTVEVDVFALLASNPTMGDTGALFNSTAVTTAGGHANITSYGAPAVAIFDTVRQAMATQLDVGQNDYISVRPSVWLGPVALGGVARVTNEAQYDIDQSNKTFYPNKSRGLFDKIVDTPRLTGSVWYAFANPSEEPVIEVGFLNGQQTPYTEMQTGFEVDGVTWKVRLDYGVAAVGWRGAHKVV